MWKYSNFENNVELNIFGKRIYIFGSFSEHFLFIKKWLPGITRLRTDPVIDGNDRSIGDDRYDLIA